MALRSSHSRHHLISILLLLVALAFFPNRVQAGGSVQLPQLDDFIRGVSNGEVDTLRGIYVPELLASRIVSQPEDDQTFVSVEDNTLTLFGQAVRVGSIGLLAHNYLAGRYFSRVNEGQVFYLVYGDGSTHAFVVTQILRYHALDPDNIWSNFIDLQHHGAVMSASNLFTRVYQQPGDVILQTCIRNGGNASWGRLFVIAEPYATKVVNTDLPHTGKR